MPDRNRPIRINVSSIEHSEQRYDTVGDWWYDEDGTWNIRVSQMHDWRYMLLVVVHELVEMIGCRYDRVSEHDITRFDQEYERKRVEGDTSEPGDSVEAPYRIQHFFATNIERLLALFLRVDWTLYEEAINAREYKKPI